MKTQTFALLVLMFLAFSVSAQTQEAHKIDEFGSIPCDDYLARRDYAIDALRKNPSATIYILVYDGKESKYNDHTKKYDLIFPTFGSAKVKIDSIKKSLRVVKIPLDKFTFVEAGFREQLTVEIWLVPLRATPPKPAPTLTKMKYRKGKAFTYCYACC